MKLKNLILIKTCYLFIYIIYLSGKEGLTHNLILQQISLNFINLSIYNILMNFKTYNFN